MRATASYLSEVLVAAAIESDAADHDGVSAVGLKTAQPPRQNTHVFTLFTG